MQAERETPKSWTVTEEKLLRTFKDSGLKLLEKKERVHALLLLLNGHIVEVQKPVTEIAPTDNVKCALETAGRASHSLSLIQTSGVLHALKHPALFNLLQQIHFDLEDVITDLSEALRERANGSTG